MGTKIPDMGGGAMLPTAVLTVAGASIVGVLKSVRLAKTQYGDKPVYTLTVEDADCKFINDKQEVEPEPKSDITFFAPTRLARQLAKVIFGSRVTIKYVGQKKVGKGNPAHVFDVEVG